VNARAYLLLDIVPGKSEEAARLLRNGAGVTVVDLIEGPPDIIAMIEASERQALAQLTIRAIASVVAMTEDVQLFPVQGGAHRRWRKAQGPIAADYQTVGEGRAENKKPLRVTTNHVPNIMNVEMERLQT
jgi:hypothetical protein